MFGFFEGFIGLTIGLIKGIRGLDYGRFEAGLQLGGYDAIIRIFNNQDQLFKGS